MTTPAPSLVPIDPIAVEWIPVFVSLFGDAPGWIIVALPLGGLVVLGLMCRKDILAFVRTQRANRKRLRDRHW